MEQKSILIFGFFHELVCLLWQKQSIECLLTRPFWLRAPALTHNSNGEPENMLSDKLNDVSFYSRSWVDAVQLQLLNASSNAVTNRYKPFIYKKNTKD